MRKGQRFIQPHWRQDFKDAVKTALAHERRFNQVWKILDARLSGHDGVWCGKQWYPIALYMEKHGIGEEDLLPGSR